MTSELSSSKQNAWCAAINMDALSFDQMLPEYQEKRKEAEEELNVREEDSHPPPPSPPPSKPSREVEEFDYEAEVGSAETIPAFEGLQVETDNTGVSKDVALVTNDSTSSSSNSIQENSSIGSASPSFYIPSVMSPSVNYERDFPAQKLIAVFGRQFDRPELIAGHLQRLLSAEPGAPSAKFVPFTMKRKSLLKGTYSSAELKKHNLICMCYNASEARILLTGVDGFYSSLLRHVEATLGPNKVAFAITSYNWPVEQHDRGLISPTLKARLSSQDPLRVYLERNQVLSWMDAPSEAQVAKLVELACLENNPQSLIDQACAIL